MLSQFYSAVEKDLCTISPSTICRERLASSFTDRPNKAYKPVAVNGDPIYFAFLGGQFFNPAMCSLSLYLLDKESKVLVELTILRNRERLRGQMERSGSLLARICFEQLPCTC